MLQHVNNLKQIIMNVKNLFFSALLTTALMSCGEEKTNKEDKGTGNTETKKSENTEKYTVDVSSTVVSWTGSMLNIYDHTGILKLKEGQLEIDGEAIKGGSFVVDVKSMQATDENYKPEEGKSKEKLIQHLLSPDFFDAEKYPTAKFEITSVEGNSVKGNLTIKEKTKEETINVSDIKLDNGVYSATGNITFNRQDYGITYSSGMADMTISDDIVLSIKLEAKK